MAVMLYRQRLPHQQPDGTVPPYMRLLAGHEIGEVLRYAADQMPSQCATVGQCMELLRTMAHGYERDGR